MLRAQADHDHVHWKGSHRTLQDYIKVSKNKIYEFRFPSQFDSFLALFYSDLLLC